MPPVWTISSDVPGKGTRRLTLCTRSRTKIVNLGRVDKVERPLTPRCGHSDRAIGFLPMRLPWQKAEMSEALLIRGATTIARHWDLSDDHKIEALRSDGFSEGEAFRLVALLPLAFSRPILEELGVRHFVTRITALKADGSSVSADLNRQPEYVGGLKLARAHRARGRMDHEIFKLIAASSADIDAASKALNAGEDIGGSTIASCLVGAEIASHLIR